MNIIRKTAAAGAALVLSLGFALPAAALNVDSTVNSATQGTVGVGGAGAGGSVNANVGVGVNVGAGTESSATTSGDSAETSTEANAAVEAKTTIAIQPLFITRADIEAGTVKATVSSPSSVTTQTDLSGYVAAEMKADTNVSSVEATSDSVAVTYKQQAKLFGFIPVIVDATAPVDAGGSVTVSYPWYAFLMVTNKSDLKARIQGSVAAEFASNAALNASAGKNGIVNANASATGTAQANANANAQAQAAAQLSAETQAKVVAAVKAAMQAELNADINASANSNVSVQ